MGEPNTTCPDCGTELQPIKLIDATNWAMGKGIGHVNLAYAAEDAKSGFFSGIAPQGTVSGRVCTECGRILLYASPKEEQ